MSDALVDIRTQPSDSLAMQQRYKPQTPPSESGSDSSYSSGSETEDEDGEQLTAHIDAAILRTLQKIRSKDASLYDPSVDVFFQEERAAEEAARKSGRSVAQFKKESKHKKVTLQDYQRQRVEELMKSSKDPARELADATMAPEVGYDDEGREELLAPAQEQELLRKQVSKAFHQGVDDDDDLFTKRSENTPKSGTYKDSILAALGEDADEETIRKTLRSDQQQKQQEAAEEKKNEDFLLDFILNQRWIDKESPQPAALTSSALKKKDEVEKGYGRDWDAEAAHLASEASFDSKADAFEATYNFRFEQGEGANTIPSFARNPKNSVRREDDSRKRKREERAARKEEEKQKKIQELARLKNLKRAQIVEKLKKLREATGSSHVEGLEEIDLEKEFDPEEHDRDMQAVFNDKYYGQEDDVDDDGKPIWNDELEIDDILAQEKPSKKKKTSKAQEDNNKIEMDADFLAEQDAPAGSSGIDNIRAQLAWTNLSKKDRKKLKKKLKAAEEKAACKQTDEIYMDADDSTAAEPKTSAREMLEEYYNLDYEDVVSDQPTRFKYTQVAPSNFGMTPVEILLADDSQLNNVVGMKQLQPYKRGKTRPANLGKRLHEFRQEMSGNKSGGEVKKKESTGDGEENKRMGRKERERKRKLEKDKL